MIPGFNTDIEHDGITYHVQTEDKGVESPVILSLVYHGGAILASKRTPYDDLIVTGLEEATLVERLQRQHKLICAAIRSGRIEDLKRMNERASPPAVTQSGADITLPLEPMTSIDTEASGDLLDLSVPLLIGEPLRLEIEEAMGAGSTAHIIKDGVADFARRPSTDDAPVLSLPEEPEIRAGSDLSLRVRLTRRNGGAIVPLGSTMINVKVLGTAFSQIDCSGQTDEDGIAIINLKIPAITSGRAVLLISTIVDGHEATLRRIVQPA